MSGFRERVAKCDISHDDLTRMRVAVVYGSILKKAEKLEINAMLGCLRDILDAAREEEPKRVERVKKGVGV